MSKENLSIIKTIIIAIVIGLLIRNFVFTIASVNGKSMYPTLNHGDKLFCLSYKKYGKVKRGDIVVVSPPIKGERRKFIKRVIGLPGETIKFEGGQVYIDGKLIEESYIGDNLTDSLISYPSLVEGFVKSDEYKLKDDQYFIMGDNRENSEDSREFGPITKKNIKSIVAFRILPFKQRGKINSEYKLGD